MATVAAVVFKHHEKNDGTYNVKIRVYHKSEKKYIETTYFVSRKQLNSKLEIKDKFLLKTIDNELDLYREEISNLGPKIHFLSCEELRDHF